MSSPYVNDIIIRLFPPPPPIISLSAPVPDEGPSLQRSNSAYIVLGSAGNRMFCLLLTPTLATLI